VKQDGTQAAKAVQEDLRNALAEERQAGGQAGYQQHHGAEGSEHFDQSQLSPFPNSHDCSNGYRATVKKSQHKGDFG
jgi:hypothetical protein